VNLDATEERGMPQSLRGRVRNHPADLILMRYRARNRRQEQSSVQA
jgi:hypothetical protein